MSRQQQPSTVLSLQYQLQEHLSELQAMQSQRRRFVRAHQVLPRHCRRRQMSWNFHRLPQALRPRAMRECKASGLLHEENKPKGSRKYRRGRLMPKLTRFIAKRCQVLRICYNGSILRLTSQSRFKLLRFTQRRYFNIVDRSSSFYSVIRLPDTTKLSSGVMFLGENCPAEIVPANGQLYAVVYTHLLSALQSEYTTSDYVNCCVFNANARVFAAVVAQLDRCVVAGQLVLSQLTLDLHDFNHQQDCAKSIHYFLQDDLLQTLDQALIEKLTRIVHAEKVQTHGQYKLDLSSDIIDPVQKVYQGLILQFYPAQATITILATRELLHQLYKHCKPITGCKEKRYLCYSNCLIDLIQWFRLPEVEKIVYRHQIPQTSYLQDRKPSILTDREVLKNIFTRSEDYITVSATTAPAQPQATMPQPTIAEFAAQNFTVNQTLLPATSRLYVQRFGREVGLSAAGELTRNGIIL